MLLVSVGEGSTGEGHENACLKELYMNAVGWLPRGNVLVIRKPASLSFQGITFSGLQVEGKKLLWGGGLCWRGGNDWGKGCGAPYLQRACHGAGHGAILGEICCENENKAGMGEIWIFAPRAQKSGGTCGWSQREFRPATAAGTGSRKGWFFIHIWKLHEVSLKWFYCLWKG